MGHVVQIKPEYSIVESPKKCVDKCKKAMVDTAMVDTQSKSYCVCGNRTTEPSNDIHWKSCIFRYPKTTITTIQTTSVTIVPVTSMTNFNPYILRCLVPTPY